MINHLHLLWVPLSTPCFPVLYVYLHTDHCNFLLRDPVPRQHVRLVSGQMSLVLSLFSRDECLPPSDLDDPHTRNMNLIQSSTVPDGARRDRLRFQLVCICDLHAMGLSSCLSPRKVVTALA